MWSFQFSRAVNSTYARHGPWLRSFATFRGISDQKQNGRLRDTRDSLHPPLGYLGVFGSSSTTFPSEGTKPWVNRSLYALICLRTFYIPLQFALKRRSLENRWIFLYETSFAFNVTISSCKNLAVMNSAHYLAFHESFGKRRHSEDKVNNCQVLSLFIKF